MNNIKKAVFYIIFKSKSTIFNMLGVGVLGTLMLVVFQQDQFYSKGTDYLILVFFVVLLGCTLLQANSIIIGWLAWAKNGESSGTEGYAKRLEAIEVRLVPKGTTPDLPASANEKAFIKK